MILQRHQADREAGVARWKQAAGRWGSWPDGFDSVLQQVHPGMVLDSAGRERAMDFVSAVADAIVKRCGGQAGNLAGGSKPVSSQLVQDTLRATIEGELAKHAVSEGCKAATKFCAGEPAAGLQFVHSDVKEMVTEISRFAVWETGASVFLAAVLEYMSAEVLELGGNAARAAGSGILGAAHVHSGITSDAELNSCFAELMGASWDDMPAQRGDPTSRKSAQYIALQRKAEAVRQKIAQSRECELPDGEPPSAVGSNWTGEWRKEQVAWILAEDKCNAGFHAEVSVALACYRDEAYNDGDVLDALEREEVLEAMLEEGPDTLANGDSSYGFLNDRDPCGCRNLREQAAAAISSKFCRLCWEVEGRPTRLLPRQSRCHQCRTRVSASMFEGGRSIPDLYLFSGQRPYFGCSDDGYDDDLDRKGTDPFGIDLTLALASDTNNTRGKETIELDRIDGNTVRTLVMDTGGEDCQSIYNLASVFPSVTEYTYHCPDGNVDGQYPTGHYLRYIADWAPTLVRLDLNFQGTCGDLQPLAPCVNLEWLSLKNVHEVSDGIMFPNTGESLQVVERFQKLRYLCYHGTNNAGLSMIDHGSPSFTPVALDLSLHANLEVLEFEHTQGRHNTGVTKMFCLEGDPEHQYGILQALRTPRHSHNGLRLTFQTYLGVKESSYGGNGDNSLITRQLRAHLNSLQHVSLRECFGRKRAKAPSHAVDAQAANCEEDIGERTTRLQAFYTKADSNRVKDSKQVFYRAPGGVGTDELVHPAKFEQLMRKRYRKWARLEGPAGPRQYSAAEEQAFQQQAADAYPQYWGAQQARMDAIDREFEERNQRLAREREASLRDEEMRLERVHGRHIRSRSRSPDRGRRGSPGGHHRDRSRSRSPDRSYESRANHQQSTECHFFGRGLCRHGANCRFRHY
jgi:hypothetical protein